MRLELKYTAKTDQESKRLLLPVCRLKFFVSLSETPPLRHKTEKIIGNCNRSVVSSISKLVEYAPEMFHTGENGVFARGMCFGRPFLLRISQCSNGSVKISVECEPCG